MSSDLTQREILTLIARAAFGLGLASVVYLSVVPAARMPSVDVWDKAQHTLAYLALMLAGGLGFRRRAARLWVALGLLALGGGLEILQTRLPMREGSVGDAFANAVGVVAGAAAIHMATWAARAARAAGRPAGRGNDSRRPHVSDD